MMSFDLNNPLPPLSKVYATHDKKKSTRDYRWLPYGMWTCEDGRQVLFNRAYRPIFERMPGMAAKIARHGEWVKFVKQEWFFDDGCSPWCWQTKRANATLVRLGRVVTDFFCGHKIKSWPESHVNNEGCHERPDHEEPGRREIGY